jgi:hypothetical protein
MVLGVTIQGKARLLLLALFYLLCLIAIVYSTLEQKKWGWFVLPVSVGIGYIFRIHANRVLRQEEAAGERRSSKPIKIHKRGYR